MNITSFNIKMLIKYVYVDVLERDEKILYKICYGIIQTNEPED